MEGHNKAGEMNQKKMGVARIGGGGLLAIMEWTIE